MSLPDLVVGRWGGGGTEAEEEVGGSVEGCDVVDAGGDVEEESQ